MANINIKPSKYMLNLLHVLPAFADEEKDIINTIVEINQGTLNKYELITETGHLKLDRVGYSSLAYPFSYGAIPGTLDEDNDPLDVVIANVTEPIISGTLAEVRILGIMKFEDDGEVDDKVIGVIADDRRNEHIKTLEDLGPQFQKETQYFWEHYKELKKPGIGIVKGFFDKKEAHVVIKKCAEKYEKEYLPLLDK